MTIPSVNIDLFLLVFMRITGMILFNPLFGRSNVPTLLKVAVSLLCAFIVTPTLHVAANINGVVEMIVAGGLELTVGLAIGVLLNIIFGVVTLAGEVMDMQMGLGMANMFDPGSGISMPVFGSFFNTILLVVFMAGDAHFTLFSIISASFKAIAPGTAFPTAASAQFIVGMGGQMIQLALQMAVPVIALELICSIAMGMLMKAVPQINIFTVGLQIQALVGIIVVFLSTSVIVSLCDRLTAFMIEKVAELIRLMVH